MCYNEGMKLFEKPMTGTDADIEFLVGNIEAMTHKFGNMHKEGRISIDSVDMFPFDHGDNVIVESELPRRAIITIKFMDAFARGQNDLGIPMSEVPIRDVLNKPTDTFDEAKLLSGESFYEGYYPDEDDGDDLGKYLPYL